MSYLTEGALRATNYALTGVCLKSKTSGTATSFARKEHQEMKQILLALTALVALSSPSIAEHPMPPMPEGGVSHVYAGECTDVESGEEGICQLLQDKEGNLYTLFWQDDELKFIRRPTAEGYETMWQHDTFNTY